MIRATVVADRINREGWCVACRADVAIDRERRCLVDRSMALPPSYGEFDQIWQDGAWEPALPRPDGYRYLVPKWLRGAPPVRSWVMRPIRRVREISPALDRMLRPAAFTKSGQPRMVRVAPQIVCGHPTRPHKARGLCELCYLAERRRAGLGLQPNRRRKTLAELGLTCAACGHDGDRQYRARGLCWACYMAQYRRTKKERAA